MGTERVHKCPICGRDAPPRGKGSTFPFCSRDCKLVDLGRWLDGDYRMPGGPIEGPDAHEEADAELAERTGGVK